MKTLIPLTAGPIAVYSGTFRDGKGQYPVELVMIEVPGGPIFTLTPAQWRWLVNAIRGARTARELEA